MGPRQGTWDITGLGWLPREEEAPKGTRGRSGSERESDGAASERHGCGQELVTSAHRGCSTQALLLPPVSANAFGGRSSEDTSPNPLQKGNHLCMLPPSSMSPFTGSSPRPFGRRRGPILRAPAAVRGWGLPPPGGPIPRSPTEWFVLQDSPSALSPSQLTPPDHPRLGPQAEHRTWSPSRAGVLQRAREPVADRRQATSGGERRPARGSGPVGRGDPGQGKASAGFLASHHPGSLVAQLVTTPMLP